MRLPLAAPAAAVAAGALLARLAEFSPVETALAATLLALLALAGLRAPASWAGMAACLAGFALVGVTLAAVRQNPPKTRVDRLVADGVGNETPARITGWVSRPPEDFGDYERFDLQIESIWGVDDATGGLRITRSRRPGQPPLELAYGERLELLCVLRPVRNFDNPGGFDYVAYLERRGIHAAGSLRPLAPLIRSPGRGGSVLQRAAWRVRRAVRARLDRGLEALGESETDAGAVLRSLLLGDRTTLSRRTETEFQRAGAYHALVVSGLHVGLLAALVGWPVRRLGGPRWAAAGLATLAAAGYAMLLDAALPVSRAAWMLAAAFGALLVYRERRALNALAGIALLFIALEPATLTDAGFQLSFGAVGLILGVGLPLIERWIEPRRRAMADLWNTDRDLHAPLDVAERRVRLRYALEPFVALSPLERKKTTAVLLALPKLACGAAALALVSAVLQIGLAAPLAMHFQRLSAAGVLVNILVMPLLALLVPAGLLGLAVGWPPALLPAAALARSLAELAAWAANGLAWDWRVPPPPLWLAAAATLSWIAVAVALHRRRGRLAAGGFAGATFLAVALHPFPPEVARGRLELTAIDVGQAEALHVGLPDGSSILIDAGGFPGYGSDAEATFDIGEAVVAPYLWSRSIRKLRALAITHADSDHISGAPAVLRNFPVDELWLAAGLDDEALAETLGAAADQGTRIVRKRVDEVDRIAGVEIAVLNDGRARAAEARNNRSLVLLASYGETDILLTGDIERSGERALIDRLPASRGGVLKVAHHGSRTSTDPAVVARFRPALAVVSAGVDNGFHHPHPETLETLRRAHVTLLSTAEMGCLTVWSDGRRLRAGECR